MEEKAHEEGGVCRQVGPPVLERAERERADERAEDPGEVGGVERLERSRGDPLFDDGDEHRPRARDRCEPLSRPGPSPTSCSTPMAPCSAATVKKARWVST